MAMPSYRSLLSTDPEPSFQFIDPPFDFNSPTVSKYPPEVTGYLLLNTLCRRMAWKSLAGKKLLDFGCGVRFARTIVNLGLDIGLYAGVDVNADAMQWLRSNIHDDRFRFEQFGMKNQMYNPGGSAVGVNALKDLGLADFDGACMFSVITHQKPEDAKTIFLMLSQCVIPKGRLYFTAFIDDTVDEYVDSNPANPCHMSTYNPDYLIGLAEASGWVVKEIYPGSVLHQPALVCDRRP
jgi:SAM-dependent methyltransferase